MFSNFNKTIFTVAIMAIFSFLTLGCSGDDNVGGATQQANFVDNDKIFPDYEYPKAGGVTEDYLMTHCSKKNSNDILVKASAINEITQQGDNYWITGQNLTKCDATIHQDICDKKEGIFHLLVVSNHIEATELKSRYNKGEFIACGKANTPPPSDVATQINDSSTPFIDNLYQDTQPGHTQGYLALHTPEYITEVKLAHFKKFATLVYENTIHSASYQKFKTSCDLFTTWNPDKFAEQVINRENCRDLFREYGMNYTKFSGFTSQHYEQLSDKVKVIDIIASFDKLPGDPEYYMVSA